MTLAGRQVEINLAGRDLWGSEAVWATARLLQRSANTLNTLTLR
jgi:hypothetical protein